MSVLGGSRSDFCNPYTSAIQGGALAFRRKTTPGAREARQLRYLGNLDRRSPTGFSSANTPPSACQRRGLTSAVAVFEAPTETFHYNDFVNTTITVV